MKFLLFIAAAFFAVTKAAFANPACAVCTVAIGASLTIAQRLGVDNCIVGIWAGAFMTIVGYWLIRWVDKKGWWKQSAFRDWVLMFISVGSIGFMYVTELTYTPVVIGPLYIDSFLFATLLGMLTIMVGFRFYAWMKEKNGGHAHFPFEKVVVPFVAVLLMSLVIHFYPVCNCGREAVDPIVVHEDLMPRLD